MPYKDQAKQREYQRKWMEQRRADWFQGKTCIDCGATTNLEIDHVDPKLKINHRVWSWAAPRRDTELAKCVVRCNPCHLRKTLTDRPKTDHGRGWYYSHYQCRCTLCRAWKRESDAKYRTRKGPEVR